MAKRFTDTSLFKKPFVRGLQGAYKLFWIYLYHDCDHAGIWIVDFEIAKIYLGSDMNIKEKDALIFFNKDEKRIIPFDNGSKWLILPFITFQYGELNENNRAHNSVIQILKKYKLYNKVLTSPLQGCKDKDKDMDKDKDKDKKQKPKEKIKKKYMSFVNELYKKIKLTDEEYLKLVDLFGKKEAEDWIERLALYINSKGDKYKSHYHTILNWHRKEEKYNKKGLNKNDYSTILDEI